MNAALGLALELSGSDQHSSLLQRGNNYDQFEFYRKAPGSVFTTLHFYLTYKGDQQARVLHYTGLVRFARNKHSSL